MMAARKGKKLSDNDEEGAVDDLAQLEALERDAESFRRVNSTTPAERILQSISGYLSRRRSISTPSRGREERLSTIGRSTIAKRP